MKFLYKSGKQAKSAVVVPTILVIVINILSSCSATKTINCPPKFVIYKNINKAYPSYAKGFNVTLANTLATADKIKDTASISVRQDIVKLKDNLNNISSRFQDLLKSNIMFFYAGICDETIRRKFADNQEKLSTIIVQLSEIEAKIGNSKGISQDNSKNVNDAIKTTEGIIKKVESGAYNIN